MNALRLWFIWSLLVIYIRKAKSYPSIFNQPWQQSCCHPAFIFYPNGVNTDKHRYVFPPHGALLKNFSIILEIQFQMFTTGDCLLLILLLTVISRVSYIESSLRECFSSIPITPSSCKCTKMKDKTVIPAWALWE